MLASSLAGAWAAALLPASTKASNAPEQANPRARTSPLLSRADTSGCERIDCSVLLEGRLPELVRGSSALAGLPWLSGSVGDTGRYGGMSSGRLVGAGGLST